MKRAVQILAAMVALLSVAVSIQFAQIHGSDERQREAIRSIMCFASNQVQTSKQRTPAEKAKAANFYNDALATIGAKPCRLMAVRPN